MGNAAAATPANGRLQTEFTAKAFVELLEDVRRFPMERLGRGGLI
jgi:creatinine amidohydrolase